MENFPHKNVYIGYGDRPNLTSKIDYNWRVTSLQQKFDIYFGIVWIAFVVPDRNYGGFQLQILESGNGRLVLFLIVSIIFIVLYFG